MKKWGMLAVTMACVFAFALAAQALVKSTKHMEYTPKHDNYKKHAWDEKHHTAKSKIYEVTNEDKTYTNPKFNLSLKYNGLWEAVEVTPDFAKNVKGHGPAATTICLTERNKCEWNDFSRVPEVQLMAANLGLLKKAKVERTPKMNADCNIIEKSTVKWGGSNANWTTYRCPEMRKWRYLTTVTMNRPGDKPVNSYTLMCSMRSTTRHANDAIAEYKNDLKPLCQKVVSTTKFSK